jgi:cysteine synthase B
MAREEALLVGVSSGANLVAAQMIGRRLAERGERGMIVTILCDGADKYLSEHFWDD